MVANIFPDAADSKLIADLRTIHTEVRLLETAVLDARALGARTSTTTTSPIAIDVTHWQAWQGTVPNLQKLDLQNQILNYFKGLRYSIVRQTNSTTGNTIDWVITW